MGGVGRTRVNLIYQTVELDSAAAPGCGDDADRTDYCWTPEMHDMEKSPTVFNEIPYRDDAIARNILLNRTIEYNYDLRFTRCTIRW